MFFALRAARRFSFICAVLFALTVGSVAPFVTAQSAGPYPTIGHQWLTVDTNLRSPSRISAWAIDDYLARYTPLPPLGHAFKQAETDYHVNALYLLAHAMHETAFGTSYIGQRYHNLFGWNAFDRDPTGLASRFATYDASIDYVASQISELYLSPGGKFYGGAATLRGMHHYASDPEWATLIARIANAIVFSTLAKRDIAFDAPVVGDSSAGEATIVTVATETGDLPDGLRVAYRFVPVAIVEAGAPTGAVPPADPDFRLASGSSANDRLRVNVTAPARAGRYRLQLQLRDSDGSVLTEYDVPGIADAPVRVFGDDAVTFDLDQTATGLDVTVANVGEKAISPIAATSGTASSPTAPRSTLSAWLVDESGTPSLLGEVQMSHTLKPGGSWTAELPSPDPALLPAVVLVRLEIAGAPTRLGGSPPGVFRLEPDGTATATTSAGSAGVRTASPDPTATDPSASSDPSASADPVGAAANPVAHAAGVSAGTIGTAASSPGAAGAGSPASSAAPFARIPLKIGALTPVDAATRLLLDPDWAPAPPTATFDTSKRKTTAVVKAGSIKLAYSPQVSPAQPGAATIRITNKGTSPLITAPAFGVLDPSPTASDGASASAVPGTEEAAPAEASSDATAILLVTAVPAWGPASEPVVLRIPLLIDVDPGKSLDVGVTLPPTADGQSSYLVVARVVPPTGVPFPATLFWLRGAPPASTAAAATGSTSTTTTAPSASAPASSTPSSPAQGPAAPAVDPAAAAAVTKASSAIAATSGAAAAAAGANSSAQAAAVGGGGAGPAAAATRNAPAAGATSAAGSTAASGTSDAATAFGGSAAGGAAPAGAPGVAPGTSAAGAAMPPGAIAAHVVPQPGVGANVTGF